MLGALRRVPRAMRILGLAAFLIYAPGAWWGAPHATAPDRKLSWGTDDETPLGPLAELHNILEPKKSRNLGYPLMYSFMAAGAYAPYLGYLKITGGWKKVSGEYPFGMEDPVSALKVLTYIAHLLTTVLAVGLVLAMFVAARTMWGDASGIAAGLLMLTCFPMFYYSRTGNVDVPMLFFTGVAVAIYAVMLRSGVTLRRAIALGAAIGFAGATKESCVYVLLPIAPVLLWHHLRTRDPEASPWQVAKPIAATAVAAVLALGFGSGLFVEPSRYFAHLNFHRELSQMYGEGKGHLGVYYPATLEGFSALFEMVAGHALEIYTAPGLVLMFIGLVVLIARRSYLGLAVALPGVMHLVFMALYMRHSALRHMLPSAVGLTLLGGFAVGWGLQHRTRWVRWAVPALAVAAISINGLRGLDLTHAMFEDSRYAAGAWMAPQLSPGDRVDHFGGSERLPPLPFGVRTSTATPHMSAHKLAPTGPATQAAIKRRWDEDPPRFIIVMPDHSSQGRLHHHTMPPATFQALEDGSLGWRRVALFQTPPLLPWVRRPALDYPSVNPPIRIYARARPAR